MNIAKLLLLYSKWDSKNEDIQKMPGVYLEVIWIHSSSIFYTFSFFVSFFEASPMPQWVNY